MEPGREPGSFVFEVALEAGGFATVRLYPSRSTPGEWFIQSTTPLSAKQELLLEAKASRATKKVRKNPFKPHARHAGASARFKSWEGGFHTGREEQTYAYAQQKWESASDGDVPVILTLDMSGLHAKADIDSRRACVMAFDSVYPTVDDGLTEERAAKLVREWQVYDQEGLYLTAGDSVVDALFGLTSPSSSSVAWQMLTDVDEETVMLLWQAYRKLSVSEKAELSFEEDATLIHVFGQAAYFDEQIDDERVADVRYMAPFLEEVLPSVDTFSEDDEDTGYKSLEDAENEGYSIMTEDDSVADPRLIYAVQTMPWDRKRGGTTEFHGTVLTNFLAACPDFLSKLPEPRDFNIPGAKSLKVLARRAQALREGGLVELIDDVDEDKDT